MASNDSADVVIVGSGIAASQIAQKLAKVGIDVLMLEAGPRIERWRVVENYRNSAYKSDFQSPYPPTKHAPHPQYSPTNGYLVQRGPEPYKAGYLRVAGGTTWHWSAQAWRLLPNDMRLQSLYGVGRDWPISYDDLEPFYYEAEVEMGVGGPNEGLGSPRSKPYPHPALELSDFDAQFKKVVEANGYKHVTEPAARNTAPFDGRPACCGNSNCMPSARSRRSTPAKPRYAKPKPRKQDYWSMPLSIAWNMTRLRRLSPCITKTLRGTRIASLGRYSFWRPTQSKHPS